jgi:hypothetical protein
MVRCLAIIHATENSPAIHGWADRPTKPGKSRQGRKKTNHLWPIKVKRWGTGDSPTGTHDDLLHPS